MGAAAAGRRSAGGRGGDAVGHAQRAHAGRGLTGRHHQHIAYEHHVLDQAGALAAVGFLIDVPTTQQPAGAVPAEAPRVGHGGDDTFSTATAKTELTALVDADSAERVRASTADLLGRAVDVTDAGVVARAGVWLSGDHLYRLHTPPPLVPAAARRRPINGLHVPPPGFVQRAGMAWRNLLITNAEMAGRAPTPRATRPSGGAPPSGRPCRR